MKIEKLNDNQIRCTLNKEDLSSRQLRLSELTYGSEKARALFSDMIQQASYECGFVTDDLPLMIEAIPVSHECLVLLITKVDDPDELDTRFSNFTPCSESESDSFPSPERNIPYADEILNCFKQLNDLLDEASGNNQLANGSLSGSDESNLSDNEINLQPNVLKSDFSRVFIFSSLDSINPLAKILSTFYHGKNSLYKNPENGMYYLILSISNYSPEVFNKVCNISSEYSTPDESPYASVCYYKEHFECIIKNKAIQVLSKI